LIDFELLERLREVVRDSPVTEAELRTLDERADALIRALHGHIAGSERRLDELSAHDDASLGEIAKELHRLETHRAALGEAHALRRALERRAREVRSGWLSG
jgi:hypothetical protein